MFYAQIIYSILSALGLGLRRPEGVCDERFVRIGLLEESKEW